jgi:beta-xylosidase
VYKTQDIEHGPWTESSFSPAFHDHSLFFDDDDRVYMVYGGGEIHLTELTADASAIKPGGVDEVIIPNASIVAGPKVGLPAEGSQLCKINGNYFLNNITWPPGNMRTQLIFRADKLTGPYEGRVALQDEGVAQGGLIDTPGGEWYALLFQDHGAVGRVPFLVPVTWKGGWPVYGVNGKVPEQLNLAPRTLGDSGADGIVASDEFTESALPLNWQWNHNPDDKLWSLSARPGYLRLTSGRIDTDFLQARNTLTQRTFGPQCAGSVSVDIGKLKDGDTAGLAAQQKKYGFVGVKRVGDSKSIIMVSVESGAPVELDRIPLNQDTVYLKVECDFRNRADKASFFYSLDAKKWIQIGKPLQMAYTLPHFMGYRFALFNFATKTTGGSADFDYFHVSAVATAP